MIRRLIIIVLVSACVLTAGMWAWARVFEGVAGGWSRQVGCLTLEHERYGYDLVLRIGDHALPRPRPLRLGQLGEFGGYISRGYASFGMPFWFPVFGFAAYPGYALIKTRRRRWISLERQLEGRCTQCGYDLTGLPEQRCPECSATIHLVAATARTVRAWRLRDAFLLFVALGIGYGLLSWTVALTLGLILLTASPRFGHADLASLFLGHVLHVAGLGSVLGIFWCSFGVPLLCRKPLSRVIFPLVLVAGAAPCVTVLLTAFMPRLWWTALPIATLALLIACVILRRTIPDAPVPGLTGDRSSDPAERMTGQPDCATARE